MCCPGNQGRFESLANEAIDYYSEADMTVDELKRGEYETIEYKQDIPKDKDKYIKTAVAYANAAGGRLIFGVENNTWEVIGFSDDEVFQKYDAIANSIFDACEPTVVPIMSIEEIGEKKIIVADIRSGMSKPYYIRKAGMMDGTYVRIAGVTRKAEPYMIKELQLEGTNRSFDMEQVKGEVSVDEANALCERMYRHALERCKSDEQRAAQKKVTISMLVTWKVLISFNDKCYPTNAWKLLTGDIEELYPYAGIQMAAFKGTSRSVFLDKQEAKGPIDVQIEEAMAFVKKHINLGARIADVYREDYYELPIDSIREMISNAVCHRSYLSTGSIQLAIYDDRLEVTSPGRLNPELTIEQIIAGNSRIQNKAIGAAFYYMHIIESWGTGIPRIFESIKAYGLGEPEIRDFGTSFRISVRRKPFETDAFGVVLPGTNRVSNEAENESKFQSSASDEAENEAKLQGSASDEAEMLHSLLAKFAGAISDKNIKRAEVILTDMIKNPHTTAQEIGDARGMSRATVQRVISEMKSAGIVLRSGSNNGGSWVIQGIGKEVISHSYDH